MRSSAVRTRRSGRREALGMLGASVGVAALGELGWVGDLFADGAQNARGTTPVQFARGSIIRTVAGDIDPTTISGATLMHEHLGSGRATPARGGEAVEPNPTQDAEWMTTELLAAKKAGLGAIVAAQTGLPGADNAEYLTTLSQRTGLRIIAAGAYYNKGTYPADFATKSDDEIAAMVAEGARVGRLGALGELGMANEETDLDPAEKKVFRAFGKAQMRTNLPIFTHANYATGPKVPMDIGLRQLDALEAGGGRPQSIAIGHMCCLDDPMADVAKRIMRRGAFVAFDRVTRQQQWVSDAKRLVMIKALLDAGLVEHLLLSSDYIGRVNTGVGEVNMYPGPLHARDGGPGYARPLVLFVPQMRKAGIDDATIRRLTVDNPRRFLAFVPKA